MAPPTIIDLGAAAPGSPIVGMAVHGGRAYVVTRGLVPPLLGELDLASGEVLRTVELPSGLGGWGAVATGEAVYAGMYGVADVHRVDLASGAVSTFPRLDAEQYIFDLALAPDGKLYAGTHPGGKVYQVDPATGGVRDLGAAVPGLRYTRSLAVGPDGTVYAGAGNPARLVAIDPATGARQQLTPDGLLDESFVYYLSVSADVVVAGTEPGGYLMVMDRADPGRHSVVATGERTIDAIAIDGRTVYFTARPSATLFAYDLDTGALTRLGVPVPGQETRGVFVSGRTVYGAAGSGLWWRWADGAATVTELPAAGLPTGPEPPQSLSSVDAGRVLVGGNFTLAVHDLERGRVTRLPVNGEAKTMTAVRGRTYLFIYPSAYVEVYDHSSGEVRALGQIGGDSNRPRDCCYDPAAKALLVGTRNQYGRTGGAFAVVDPGSGRIDRYDDLVPDQAIASVAAGRGVAYLGTEIAADGVAPTATEAAVVAFDLTDRTPLWIWRPVPDATGYIGLRWHDGLLYGVTTAGQIFVGDPATRTVRATGTAPAGRPGRLALRRGQVVLATADALLRVGPDGSVEPLVTGLAAEWGNDPQLGVDDSTGDIFALRARNLVRIRP